MDFVDSKMYTEVEKDLAEMRFVVGHNRWATTGASDEVKNAHPFQEGDITLVHNGTLDFDGGLLTPMELLGTEVDSHAICHNLDIYDAKAVLEKLEGAFTLIWHDKRDDSLNFARNWERPLAMWIPDNPTSTSTIYFASERKMMEWIMSRNRIPTASGKFQDLPTGEHWKFLPGSLEPEVTDIPLNYGGYQGGYWNGQRYNRGSTVKKTSTGGNQSTTTTTTGGTYSTSGPKFGVPDPVNGWLNREGFDRTDRLPFLPHTATGGVVVGLVECLDVPALVLSIKRAPALQQWDRRWTVRPVGMRYIHNNASGGEQPTLICKLVSWHFHDSMYEYGNGWLCQNLEADAKLAEMQEELNLIDDDLEAIAPFVPSLPAPEKSSEQGNVTEIFLLGRNKLGTKNQWFEATKNGCSMCQQLPPSHSAEHIVWLDDGYGSFICAPCSITNHIGD
jgi:hypothetical protein